MARKVLPIGTYQYDHAQASARKLINCTAEQATPDSGNLIVLRRMPGVDLFATAGSKVRGRHFFKGELYVVSSASLFKVSVGGTVSTIGSVPGTGRVTMADNGISLVIVAPPLAYQSDGVTVSQITDSVFLGYGGVSDVGFLDTFFVFTVVNSRVSFTSEQNAVTFNALDFTTIDGSTDNILGLIIDHREIIYLKEVSAEIWYLPVNPNVTGFPMSRSPNGYLEIGCAAADTAAKLGGAVYWLANDGTVRQLSGLTASIISTAGISKFITPTSEAYGFGYTFEDKHYYVLALPDVTLEYDILAKEWHNRETFQRATWQVLSIIQGYESALVFNSTTGQIGKLSRTTRDEWGLIQKVQWTYQEISGDGRLVGHIRFELQIGTGVGLTSGQGSDPQLELEASDDGGKQFRSLGTKSLGKIGEYLTSVSFTQLGSARHRVYRCGISDAVDVIAFGTDVEVRGGGF